MTPNHGVFRSFAYFSLEIPFFSSLLFVSRLCLRHDGGVEGGVEGDDEFCLEFGVAGARGLRARRRLAPSQRGLNLRVGGAQVVVG